MAMVSSFFEEEKLSRAQMVGVCMDGTPSMLSSRSGLCLTLILRIPAVPFCLGQFIHLFILLFVTLVKERTHVSSQLTAFSIVKLLLLKHFLQLSRVP